MKIFAAGIATESNTFSPEPTGLEDFNIQRGRDVLAGKIDHPALDLSRVWGRMAREAGHDFSFGLMAWAQPGGTTLRSAYETLREELLADLCAGPVDIALLMLHGAMVAEGCDDCEEDLIRRVRHAVGPACIIGVELDLHCHLRGATIADADVVITYKEYPHVDCDARASELFTLAVAAKQGKIRPVMALFDCRMVGLYPTTIQPLRGFVDAMTAAEKRPGILSVSFGHGFQFADVPHVGAKVLVVADRDRDLARRTAQELGLQVHALRKEIGFESMSLPLEQALTRATEARKFPVVIADQSDNTGGGAPGDSSFALRWLLDRRVQDAALALHYDPEAVRIAKKAGSGATLRFRLGGKMGPASGDPVDLTASVLAIREDYLHAFPQDNAEPWLCPAGDVVSLRAGGVDILLSSLRCQVFCPSIFRDLGLDLAAKRLLVVKSSQHFHGAFAPIASEVIYMAAPGAVPTDPRLITYRRFDPRRAYPWNENPLQ